MISLAIEGRANAERRSQERTGWLAWHIGLLTGRAVNNPKKYPKLDALIGKPGKKLRRRRKDSVPPWQRLLGAAMAWNSAINANQRAAQGAPPPKT